jgi:serine/threonine protein phosphatase PrpC
MTTTVAPSISRPGGVALRSAGVSDAGRVRENNEDRFHLDNERGIFIVVDGVGGQAGGETAAETALLQLRTRLERESGSPEERLREGITLANNEVFRLSRTNAEWDGMACVLTAALVEDDALTIGHVGDSRLYRIRPGVIDKLTHDHSPVGQREDAGELDELEAMRHPRRNEVYRDVGSGRHTPGDEDFVEIVKTHFAPDEALLLCSDGLSDLVTSHEILETATRLAGDPDAVVKQLIAQANRAGGKDNVTAIYVEGGAFASRVSTPAAEIAPVSEEASAGAPSVTVRFSNAALMASHALAVLSGAALALTVAYFYGDRLPWPLVRPSAPAGAPAARTLVVQQAAPAEFATIAGALAVARSGDTVVVGPGEYREQVRLRDGVSVISQEPQRAVIRVPSNDLTAAVIADGIRGARLRGFQIVGEGRLPTGIVVRNSEFELDDTRVSGASLAGVDVSGQAAVTLRANDISDNAGVGVRVRRGAAPWLFHNSIERNGRGRDPQPGVLLDDGAAPVLMANVIADNAAEGVAGVPARDAATIQRNNVFIADSRGNARGALRIIGGAPERR